MSLDTLRGEFEKEIAAFKQLEKDREKYVANRQTLESQLTENQMVKEELDLLGDESKVFKLIGAVLVKVELAEARSQVEKRLEYIQGETKRVEDQLTDSTVKTKNKQKKLSEMQEQIQKAFATAGKK